MTLDEFIKTANLRGLANKEIAREYGKGRAEFTEDDLEAVYRYQNGVYAGGAKRPGQGVSGGQMHSAEELGGQMLKLMQGDCLEEMKKFPDGYIDLTVTSPPYDNLRTYNGNIDQWTFEKFQEIAKQLYRTTAEGGVVVWVVGDATIKGSETGTSFRQALWFKECGFNLHDTMIWEKTGMLPTQDRYYNIFEYMFILSKGKPHAMNFIEDKPNVNGGKVQRKDSCINKGHNAKADGFFVRKDFGRRTNIWRIGIGRDKSTQKHPAPFPLQLASDHIATWSNVGDVVLDPFMGSGTTGVACVNTNRNFIGIELDADYFKIAEKRIADAQNKPEQISLIANK